jgi:glycogen synthase
VHLNTFVHGALPWTAPVLMVGHSCVLSWWQAVKGEAAPSTWATYQRRVQAGLSGADLVVAPTRVMLAALETYYGPFRATQVIYNARCPTDFDTEVKEEFIFAMGRVWDEAKNVALLDQVALNVPWPIYVAGKQEHPSGRRLELSHLHTLGQLGQQEVRDVLARASLYVLPARYEPFGLSALEAALSGCVLVLGNIASLREVWGQAAVYVSPDDPSMLADVLCDLARQPERRAALAGAAKKRAKRYSPEVMGQSYWQAYNHLVEHTDRASGLRARKAAHPLPQWRTSQQQTTP